MLVGVHSMEWGKWVCYVVMAVLVQVQVLVGVLPSFPIKSNPFLPPAKQRQPELSEPLCLSFSLSPVSLWVGTTAVWFGMAPGALPVCSLCFLYFFCSCCFTGYATAV